MSLAKFKYQIPEILTAGEDDSSEYVDLHYSEAGRRVFVIMQK